MDANLTYAHMALKNAKTSQCRANIKHAACYYQTLLKNVDVFDNIRLTAKCPATDKSKVKLLCKIKGVDFAKQINAHKLDHFPLERTKKIDYMTCRDICFTLFGYPYIAYFRDTSAERLHQCVCMSRLSNKMLGIKPNKTSTTTSAKDKSKKKQARDICNCNTADAFEIYPTLLQGLFFCIFFF